MKHVMLDIETLSSNSHAAIIQIGACEFDLHGGITNGFETTIDFTDAVLYGEASGSTLQWWFQQSAEAQKSVASPTEQFLRDALRRLNSHISTFSWQDARWWAHATFDFPILMNAYEKTGVQPLVKYRQMRDLRTLEEVAGEFITWEKREGTHHNALDDAKFQAKHAAKMLGIVELMTMRYGDDK